MTNWKYYLRFKSFWHDDEISIQDKGKLVAKQLLQLQKQMNKHMKDDDWYSGDYFMLEDMAEWFDNIRNVHEFDDYLKELYDFADRYKIWVETF